MVRGTARPAVLLLALLGALGGVAVAGWSATHHYYVELAPYPRGGTPTSGTLDLDFREGGGIVGFYRPSDGGMRTVSGQAYSANRIALDFGGTASLHVSGTLDSGGIVGRAYDPFTGRLYSFRGLAIPNDQSLPHMTPAPWPN